MNDKRKPLIKLCGMCRGEDIQAAEAAEIDLIGLIFYPKSPRYVEAMPCYLPEKKKRVGVFVNADVETILRTANQYQLTFIQLHGEESPDTCRQLRGYGYNIIKAFQISNADDLKTTTTYQDVCNYLLFDTKSSSYGGTGQIFDWSILQCYKGSVPFLLSGGIGIDILPQLKHFYHPMCAGFDLNSKFEIRPGQKDISLVQQFIKITGTI